MSRILALDDAPQIRRMLQMWLEGRCTRSSWQPGID